MTPKPLEDLVKHLMLRLESKQPRWLIGMAGLPGSGKSTLADLITQEVNHRAGSSVMMALSMDGFHLPKAELRKMPDPEQAFARRGAPWTFAPAALAHRLQMLREGAKQTDVQWPDFQHEVGDPVEAAHTVSPAIRIVLVEGLYLLYEGEGWDAVGRCLDEKWYLDVPLKVAMERLASRHMAAWGLTRHEAEARIASNDGLNATIVASTRDHATWLLKDR